MPDIPDSYAFTGGAARAIFQEQCLGEESYVRDKDITSVDELSPDIDLAKSLSEDYMAEDYKNGYGVSNVDFNKYFRTRDLIMNEVLATNKRLYLTKRAAVALKDKLIDLTDYEIKEDYQQPKYKLSTKAVLLEQIFQYKYGRGEIVNPDYVCQKTNEFSVALQLNKALQISPEIALNYIDSLVDYDMLDPSFKEKSLKECVDYFSYNFEFRNVDGTPMKDLPEPLSEEATKKLINQMSFEEDYPELLNYNSLKKRDRSNHRKGRHS